MMAHYLLSVHIAADAEPRNATDEDQRERFDRIAVLEEEMRSAGALQCSGRLEKAAAAAVVRAGNGTTTTTDGPFVEAKEALGGFYIIEAASRDAALRWGEKTSAAIGMPIEVRGFSGFRGDA